VIVTCFDEQFFAGSPGGYMTRQRIWAIRPAQGGFGTRIFFEQSLLALNSSEASGDIRTSPVLRTRRQSPSAARPEPVPGDAGQLDRFVHDVQIGDCVVSLHRAENTVYWGEIAGPYVFQTTGACNLGHRRSVRWITKQLLEKLSAEALYELDSALSLFEVKSCCDELLAIFATVAPAPGLIRNRNDTAETLVRDIDEKTRAFISGKFRGELKGYPLEPFVAELFRAMGYHARATRQVRDDGIDVIAHRDELGIEPPIIKIQVKAQESNVGADSVKAFYAMVHDRDVGIFMTTGGYSSTARDFARQKGNLRLFNGSDLADLVLKYYDGLGAKYRQQIPLRRVLIPDVAAEDTALTTSGSAP